MGREQTVILLIPALALLSYGNQQKAKPSQRKVKYAALGDSLAVGLLTLGSGYVKEYSKWLVQNRYPQGVELTNLGTSGWKSGDIVKALQEDRFYRETVRAADILTLDIGGNDLLGSTFTPRDLRHVLSEYQANLKWILANIRELNPGAPFYLMDLYSPYPEGHPRKPLADIWIPLFNREIHALAENPVFGITGVARVYTAFSGHEKEYTWIDEFGDIHPNALGHHVICQCFTDITR